MEQIINGQSIQEILAGTKVNKDQFFVLLKTLYFYCIEMDINNEKINFDTIEKEITRLHEMEKISFYIFSQYNNTLLNDIDPKLKKSAMEVAAISFEKLGNYIEKIETDKIEKEDTLYKQMRYYFRSSIAYQLSGNSPSSVFMSKKFGLSFKKLRESNYEFKKRIEDLYELGYQILSRNFHAKDIKDIHLKEFLYSLTTYIRSGNEESYLRALLRIQEISRFFLNNFFQKNIGF